MDEGRTPHANDTRTDGQTDRQTDEQNNVFPNYRI